MKLWDQKVEYNYYPVCYEAVCRQDSTAPLGWLIDVTIGNSTVTCTNQLEELSNFSNQPGDSIFCPARFDVFCTPHYSALDAIANPTWPQGPPPGGN